MSTSDAVEIGRRRGADFLAHAEELGAQFCLRVLAGHREAAEPQNPDRWCRAYSEAFLKVADRQPALPFSPSPAGGHSALPVDPHSPAVGGGNLNPKEIR
jgi:hypothetical protein